MREKFVVAKHAHILKNLPFSFFSTALYAEYAGYVEERNGESLLVTQDLLFPESYPLLFAPGNPDNLKHAEITFGTEAAIERITTLGITLELKKPITEEFFYPTARFTEPTRSIRRDSDYFARAYSFEVQSRCDREIVEVFYGKWERQKSRTGLTYDESKSFFSFCLDNLDRYSIEQIYVLREGELVGCAFGMQHSEGRWVGLGLKADYRYRGLSRYLHRKRAERFMALPECTLGTGSFESGIEQYKRSLKPSHTEPYYFLVTGGLQKCYTSAT